MAFWFWVVILSIIGLGMFEVYSRYKERNNPLAEDVPAEESAEEVQAELARANMKIAMLESRLEESEAKLEEEATALAALEERYQQQLDKTEKAYQRQMVNLSERLAAKSNGWGGEKNEPEVEYPVRMATEVAAWRASLGGQPLVEPAVSEDLAALADNIEENIEAQNPAIDAPSEETADPNNGSLPATTGKIEITPEVVVDTAASLVVADLTEEVEILDLPLEPEKEVLDQVVVLDEIAAEPLVDEEDLEVDGEETAGSEIEITIETDDVVFEEPGETAVAVEEIPPLENRWPDLESMAMQRVMTRQLGSEMDADYLDDEEFLREMGIENEAPVQESSSDEAAETDTWITDPLEEMAYHINGSEQPPDEARQRELLTSNEAGRQTQKITDHMWEEVIFNSMAEQDDDPGEPDLASAAVTGEEIAVSDTTELDHDDEEAAIAAAVASILSRAPDQADTQFDGESLEQEGTGSGSADNDRQAFVAVEDSADEDPSAGEPPVPPLVGETAVFDSAADVVEPLILESVEEAQADPAEGSPEPQCEEMLEPEEPDLVWEREPVLWQAEYFDNTGLSDDPVLVRQDSDIDFEWLDSAPAQGLEPRTFSVRWSGNLPLDPGQYRFTAAAPDGLRLWLNERLVISAWYDQSEQTYQRDFAWRGGAIDVRVEHYENGGNAKAFLTWDRIA